MDTPRRDRPSIVAHSEVIECILLHTTRFEQVRRLPTVRYIGYAKFVVISGCTVYMHFKFWVDTTILIIIALTPFRV